MFINKCNQSSAYLQAFPNLTITENKGFLFIKHNLNSVITRKMIAAALGVTPRTATTVTNKLQKVGLITKTRRKGYYNDFNHYTITPKGEVWMPYLVNTYKVHTGIFKRAMLSLALLICPSPSSFTLLKEDIYISPLVKRELLTRACARRVAMSTPIDSKEVLDAQDLLSLSQWGMIRLSAFPKEAIGHANFSFRSSKSKKDDPFKWFLSICDEWCRKHNVEPDLVSARKMAKDKEMPSQPEWIVPRPVLEIPKKGKLRVGVERKAFSEEQKFIETVHAIDKLKQLEKLGQLSPLQHMVMQNLMKQIQPFMSNSDGSD